MIPANSARLAAGSCVCLLLLLPACSRRATAGHVPASTPESSQLPPMQVDQANTAAWDGAWTNLVNDVEQSFVPSLPKLTAIEVGLVVGNKSTSGNEVTLAVIDGDGTALATVTNKVPAEKAPAALFTLPNSGIALSPGQTYHIKLSGSTRYGWKYVVGGYSKGAATFNGKPLLPTARSTFLFKTFGSE